MGKRKKTDSNKVANLKRYITSMLEEADMYDPTLTYQIELLASDLLVYRKFRDKALSDEEEVVITAKGSTGQEVEKINPVFYALVEWGKRVRDGLDCLTMNIKSKKPEKKDKAERKGPTELEALYASVRAARDI